MSPFEVLDSDCIDDGEKDPEEEHGNDVNSHIVHIEVVHALEINLSGDLGLTREGTGKRAYAVVRVGVGGADWDVAVYVAPEDQTPHFVREQSFEGVRERINPKYPAELQVD